MKGQRARRLCALTAIGVLMAGGAAVGAAGTASAATPHQTTTYRGGCDDRGGWWNGYCDGYGYGYGYGNRGDFYRNGFVGGGGVVVIVLG